MDRMDQVNIHAAKTQLSRLVERAHAGEEIVIAKAGKPYARLVPLERPQRRKLGLLGIDTRDDFFKPLPDEELNAWE